MAAQHHEQSPPSPATDTEETLARIDASFWHSDLAARLQLAAIFSLAFVALVWFMDQAQAVFAPLLLALLLSYALYPIVARLARWGVPRAIGAVVVVGGLCAALWFGAQSMQDQLITLIDRFPDALREFRDATRFEAAVEESVIEKLQEAADEVGKVAGDAPVAPGQQTVIVKDEPFDLNGLLLGGSYSLLIVASQALSVLLMLLYLLSSGRMYREKLVRIFGETISEKKSVVTILDEINTQLQRYYFVTLIGAIFVGIVTWLAFWYLTLEQAAAWGVIAGIASMVPYIGPAFVFAATGVVAFVQFGTLTLALVVAGISLLITSIQGNVITPLMTSRTSTLNAPGIFVFLLFFGWLWGPVGLIVATPIQMMIKALADHVEGLEPIGELLGK